MYLIDKEDIEVIVMENYIRNIFQIKWCSNIIDKNFIAFP